MPKPYVYVCEISNCPEPATRKDVEDYLYLCNDHFMSVVKGII
jgi:hypothetical protein